MLMDFLVPMFLQDELVLFLLPPSYFRLAFADCPSLLYNSWTEAMYEWP